MSTVIKTSFFWFNSKHKNTKQINIKLNNKLHTLTTPLKNNLNKNFILRRKS